MPCRNYFSQIVDSTLLKHRHELRRKTPPLIGILLVGLYAPQQLRTAVTNAGFKIEEEYFITYFCFPISHNIVYGFGKELLLAGLLPSSIAKASDRFTYDENQGSLWNPVNLMRTIFLKIDSLNDRLRPGETSVNIAMKLLRPT